MMISVRLATNDDGEQIGNMVQSQGFYAKAQMDWSDIVPHWIVAEKDGVIVGTIQVCPGKPMGRIETLVIDSQIEGRERAMTVKYLVTAAKDMLAEYGAQVATGFVPHEEKSYRNVLKKRGAVTVDHGALYAYRLV